jgi:hypothetical protein
MEKLVHEFLTALYVCVPFVTSINSWRLIGRNFQSHRVDLLFGNLKHCHINKSEVRVKF